MSEQSVSVALLVFVGMFGVLAERGWEPLWWTFIFVGLLFAFAHEENM